MSIEPRFAVKGRRRISSAARAYVYGVCAAMLNDQYMNSPENIEGWMFGGIENDSDRELVLAELKRLEAEMDRRANKWYSRR